MYPTSLFKNGGYRYIPSVFQYSAGVAAEPGFQLEQVRFKTSLPLRDAFKRIEQHLTQIGRPLTAFAHCELRSPGQFNDQGFIEFNKTYVGTLEKWGLYQAGTNDLPAINPVARTNVCPEYFGPSEVALQAFTYTVPNANPWTPSFVLSGGGDAQAGDSPYRDRIIAYGDTSESGLRLKMEFVAQEMRNRLLSLGFDWSDVNCAQAYSIHNIGSLVEDLFAKTGRMGGGLNWHFARPPVAGLDFEMDLSGSVRKIILE